MKKKINALIVDDIECVALMMRDRLFEVNKKYSYDFIDISPEIYIVDVTKGIEQTTIEIKRIIEGHSINYLLIDRGYSKVVDVSYKEEFANLDIDNCIYTDRREGQPRFTADDVFSHLKKYSNKTINNLIGILVYTNTPIKDVLPEVVHQELMLVLPSNFKKDKLFVLESHQEIYKPAGNRLHIFEEDKQYQGIFYHGKMKDFKLYGTFMGDILYNQIRYHRFEKKEKSIESVKYKLVGTYLIGFFTFISLNIGSNMLANHWLKETPIMLDYIIIGLGVLIPSIVIWLKPEIFIFNNERKNKE